MTNASVCVLMVQFSYCLEFTVTHLVLLLYINDLPKIINKTSAPIIFADDTSILLTHSNLTDFNKNISTVLQL